MAFTTRNEALGARTAPAASSTESFRQPAPMLPHTPGDAWIEERTRIAVGPGINVSGRLVFQEPVRIEGRLRGEVSSSELVVISEQASVEGKVRTPRVLILGELTGDVVDAKSVVLGPRARVKGNIDTESLTICEGAQLEGDVRTGASATGVPSGAKPPG
ncbi:MAG TPA: polymer-forming cytoskeletal protein [Candidatus Binataceae bacterium]|nr:polymer-forming cytoskeletal protein [Candidatus Binataceae bacterium]